MIFSRDNQIALAVKVHNMLARMRAGYFQPDLPRVLRLFDLAAQVEREQDDPPEVTVSASSSDHSDDSCMASSGEELDTDHRLPRPNPMDIDVGMCVVHRLSSILHGRKPLPVVDILGCGRMISRNFRPAQGRDLKGNKSIVCTGCSRYWRSWEHDS